MNFNAFLKPEATLSATLIRADGSHREIPISTMTLDADRCIEKLIEPMHPIRKLYHKLVQSRLVPVGLTVGGFMAYYVYGNPHLLQALVTTAGINLLAADFVSGAGTHIAAFNYHDSGTGTTAANIADTTLGTQAGPATRATGTQSTPIAGTYRSLGTINYLSTLAIAEWGLFSQAASGGTLWDRRVSSVINVNSGDSISWQYSVVMNPGGA